MGDEPKPKRTRSWLVFLVVAFAVGLGAYLGRSNLKHVVMGWPQWAARIVLLGDRGDQFVILCGGGPKARYSYPTPYIRAEYPEYGFNVIYHGDWRGPGGNTSDWKVIAVEDRE